MSKLRHGRDFFQSSFCLLVRGSQPLGDKGNQRRSLPKVSSLPAKHIAHLTPQFGLTLAQRLAPYLKGEQLRWLAILLVHGIYSSQCWSNFVYY